MEGLPCRFIYTYGISENTRRIQGLSRNRAETADLCLTVLSNGNQNKKEERAATCDTPQGASRIYNSHPPVAGSFLERQRIVEEREDTDHAFFFKR